MAIDTQSTLAFRTMQSDDITAIVALEVEAFHPPWSRALLERALANAHSVAIVAINDAVIVGYALGWTLGAEGELDRIAVAQSCRGQGIGAHLLPEWLRRCRERGAKEFFLEVREGNRSAQHLYESCGFARAGRRPRYYDDGETALIMRLEYDAAADESEVKVL